MNSEGGKLWLRTARDIRGEPSEHECTLLRKLSSEESDRYRSDQLMLRALGPDLVNPLIEALAKVTALQHRIASN